MASGVPKKQLALVLERTHSPSAGAICSGKSLNRGAGSIDRRDLVALPAKGVDPESLFVNTMGRPARRNRSIKPAMRGIVSHDTGPQAVENSSIACSSDRPGEPLKP